MNGKKALPLFVIASIMLSLIPTVLFANATLGIPVLDVNHGVKGAEVHVTGGTVPAGTTVQLYWDDSTIAWNGVKGLLNSTKAAADGTYEVWFLVPEGVAGAHYLWVKTTNAGIADTTSIGFTVDSQVKLSPSRGLPGDTITAKLYGFAGTSDVSVTFNAVEVATGTTNSLGTATVTFKVPNVGYDPYPVSATDEDANEPLTAATFTVGAVITLSSTSGTVGSVIQITGRGFDDTETIGATDVTLVDSDANVVPVKITTTTPVEPDINGRVRFNVVIPQGDDVADDYQIVIASAAGNSAADYEITALAKVSVTPAYGPVASSITVSGVNYPKIKDVTITVELDDGTAIGTVKTLADGTFSKVFRVPAAAEGTNPIVAFTNDYYIGDDAGFKVGSMNIILSDDSGPTGMTITLTGNGFTHGGEWNATFGSKTLAEGVFADGAGLIEATYTIPQMALGTYTISVYDIDADITLTTTFKITATTTVTLDVPTAPNGFNVTFTGSGFSDQALGTLDVTIYNKTSTGVADWWMGVDLLNKATNVALNAETDDTGAFKGYWVVEDADVISKGNYYFNVTDASGDYSVTIPFTIGAAHLVAEPRKATFNVGETISFVLEYSFKGDVDASYLKIYDPSGALVYSGDDLTIWTKTGLWYTSPYSSQTAGLNPMVLRDDAPLGTWSWKWIDNNGDTAASGTFVVAASAASATDAKITALATQITALQTAVTGLQTAATAAGTKADAATAAATASGAKADAATAAATAAGTKADAAATAAASAAASAKSAADGVSGLSTLVYAAIGASLVAALAAIVALMQISRKIA